MEKTITFVMILSLLLLAAGCGNTDVVPSDDGTIDTGSTDNGSAGSASTGTQQTAAGTADAGEVSSDVEAVSELEDELSADTELENLDQDIAVVDW